jgi:hypothetical protein
MEDPPGIRWQKSSYSGNSGNCVEVLMVRQSGIVAVRDSKQVPGPELTVTADCWALFLRGVKRGQFNLDCRTGR